MRTVRTLVVLALALHVGVLAALVAPPASAADSGSSVTQSGTGEFAALKVTVSKTKNLLNEVVHVSWTGGGPTVDPTTAAGAPIHGNVLQIMQCWGDAPGPDRSQCVLGSTGFAATGRLAQADLDPQEGLKPAAGQFTGAFIPFWAAGKPKPDLTKPWTSGEAANDPYFDLQSTNQIDAARTGDDGTGAVDFEAQSLRESNGLGCGTLQAGAGTTAVNPCWLVVVPRGTTEANGKSVLGQTVGLTTSPLSPTNWAKRIAFRLDFLPVGQPCQIGPAERPIRGNELAVTAVSSWQPALCAGGGDRFNYTQLTDDQARAQLNIATDPSLAVVTDPPAGDVPADRPRVYAPLAVSALTVAFNIMRRPKTSLPPGDPARAGEGTPFTSMKLDARLVAKLLTQSYKGSVVGYVSGQDLQKVDPLPGVPATNPYGLTGDPEFLRLNPDWKDWLPPTFYTEVLVQGSTSDLTDVLWTWILSDPDAKAFVTGTPDPGGMVVNKNNKGPTLPLTTYPRNDNSCVPYTADNSQYCSSDAHAFTQDMHDAAQSAARGVTQQRSQAKSGTGTSAFDKFPRQALSERALIAITDVATARQFGLATAALQKGTEFVAPEQAGLAAGLAAMKPSPVAGVLSPDPTTAAPGAYPLTAISYAAAVPADLTPEVGKSYANLLRYAAGAGQTQGSLPGQLPVGYLPLTDALRRQTVAAAAAIETQAGKKPAAESGSTPGPSTGGTSLVAGGATGSAGATGPGGSTGPGTSGPGTSGPGTSGPGTSGPGATTAAGSGAVAVASGGTGAAGAGPGAAPAAGGPAPAGATTSVTTQNAAATQPTPALPAPAVGALLVALLIGGGLAAVSAPVTHLLSKAEPAGGGDKTDRTPAARFLAPPTARPALFARRR